MGGAGIMVKILTIFLVGAVLFVLLLRIFFVQCIGKESESPLPTKMSSPGRMIVKSITGNGVPASPSVAGSASGAVTTVCGNGANVGRYETRNDALRSIMRSRSLTKEDAAALMAYLASTNDAMRVERVAALKNDVMNLLRRQGTPVAGLAETLVGMFDCGAHPRASAATARRYLFCARCFPLPAATQFSTSSPSAPSGFSAIPRTFRDYRIL